MNKFYGTIGFVKTEETAPGVWTARTEEHGYCGDLVRNIYRNDGTRVNTDFNLNNQVSIVGDPFALENFQFIKFVRFLGSAWKVTSVEVNYPRLVLTIGEVYTEEVGDE